MDIYDMVVIEAKGNLKKAAEKLESVSQLDLFTIMAARYGMRPADKTWDEVIKNEN